MHAETLAHYATNRLLQRLFPPVSSGCTAVIGNAANYLQNSLTKEKHPYQVKGYC
jgi:hypothetical protein